jgi:general secretion pathway protein G
MKRWWIIIVLLLLAGASMYFVRSSVRAQKERELAAHAGELRESVGAIRKAIQAFHKDTGRYPLSLYELVPKYLQRVPVDPMTGATDWRLITEERVEASSDFTAGGTGAQRGKPEAVIIDVRSTAPGYSEY